MEVWPRRRGHRRHPGRFNRAGHGGLSGLRHGPYGGDDRRDNAGQRSADGRRPGDARRAGSRRPGSGARPERGRSRGVRQVPRPRRSQEVPGRDMSGLDAVVHPETPEGKKAWLLARKRGLTSTDAAAVLGLNPHKNAWDVFVEKQLSDEDLLLESANQEAELAEAVRWGHLLEEPIAGEVALRLERRLENPGRYTLHYNHDLPVPLLASLDRKITRLRGWDAIKASYRLDGDEGTTDPRGDGLAEIKAVSAFIDREEWQDEGPVHYITQLQQQLVVTGLSWGVLAGLSGGQTLRIIEHQRDDEFCSWMLDRLQAFWEGNVLKKTPPPIDGSEATAAAIGRYYRGAKGIQMELPVQAIGWAKVRTDAKVAVKHLETSITTAENLIKGAIGEATVGLLPGG